MRALVTGASGFVGRWLTRALIDAGHEVHGTTMEEQPSGQGGVTWHHGDLRDAAMIERVVVESAPEWVFHLAGVSSVAAAEANPGLASETNVGIAVRLLTELARLRDARGGDPLVLIAGSGEQYGRHPEHDLPLGEDASQRPLTLYAATKAAQEVIALQLHRRHQLRVIAARSFNHSGAGQGENFLLPALVRRAIALRRRSGAQLLVGNTSPVRDFTHVSDVVRAYILLAERGRAGEAYNVCSGEGRSVREAALMVLRLVGVDAELEEDPKLVRPVDIPALVGNNRKLRSETGWSPRFSFEDCLRDLIDAETD